MEKAQIYYVEVCDYEACWYVSIWDNAEEAEKHFDEYCFGMHEQYKTLGVRELNTRKISGHRIRIEYA